ncbi:uncharacterized protein LOC125939952 isoform X1 [Dermacentor silvarum]|uniref:uncharacterized protein LOC125939952 isoform X1 n=1 Tax=Dermacentor silvarum TaxID=543639 RepID=UPI0021008AC8|nr:uncharacterized protein LOC125939952 isoform X1 [Dermacentor silvarum]
MRTTAISNTSVQYNESSSLVGSNWTDVYSANFSTNVWPPVEMEYKSVVPPQDPRERYFMILNYTTPVTYKCSVVIAALRGQDWTWWCYMYIRGGLQFCAYPPAECENAFLKACPNGRYIKYYNWTCPAPEGKISSDV